MIAVSRFHVTPPRTWLSTWWIALLGVALPIGSASTLFNTYRLLLPYPDWIIGALTFLDVQREGLTALRH